MRIREKIMSELLDGDPNPRHRLALAVPHDDGPLGLAVFLNGGVGLRRDLFAGELGWLSRPVRPGQDAGGSPGAEFEKCPSIHRTSKQQPNNFVS